MRRATGCRFRVSEPEIGWGVWRTGRGLALLSLVLLATFLSAAWVHASQPVIGTVVGEVISGSADAVVPADLAVTLHVFSDTDETGVYTTTVTPDGGFRFEDISFGQGETLVARTVYDGVRYVSEPVTLESDEPEVTLPITVYETTNDPSGVAVAQLHVFLQRVEQQLQVGQYCVISNNGTRTYVGSGSSSAGGGTTWAVNLPSGAENLRFDGGELGGRFVGSQEGFADTRAIPPGRGSVEASFTYALAYSEGLRVEQAFDVPVQSVVLVVPGGGVALEGTGLSAGEMVDTQMGPALSYTGGPLAAGEELSFTVVAGEVAASGTEGSQQSDGLVLGIAALAVAVVAVYWLWQSPLPGSMPAGARDDVEGIAALDRDFERGHVSEEAYRKRRRALKQRLHGLLSD